MYCHLRQDAGFQSIIPFPQSLLESKQTKFLEFLMGIWFSEPLSVLSYAPQQQGIAAGTSMLPEESRFPLQPLHYTSLFNKLPIVICLFFF